jgi:hypothetical protein
VKKTVVVVFRRAVVHSPDALTGFVVDLCGSISTDRCAARGCLYGTVTYLMPRHGRLLGAPLPIAALVGHALPAASAIAGPHAKQLVQCALGYF